MKKLQSLIMAAALSVCITTALSAQKQIVWFDAGLRVMGGAGAMFNSSIADNPLVDYDLALTNSFGIGGRIGINKAYSGLSLEAMYNQFGTTYEYDGGLTNGEATWQSLDVYALFRNAKNLGYFEIGPKVSFLEEATDGRGGNATPNYASTNIGAALGFGAYVLGTEGAFSATLGLRFEYGITNYVNEDAPEGYNLSGAIYTTDNGTIGDGGSDHPIFVGIVFEANFGIGYVGVAQCGARSKFMMF
jgi:hypothetical protein